MEPTGNRKLTAKELADSLGCSVSTVYRLKLAGRLPFVQPGGKGHMVRFDRDCLDRQSEDSELPETHRVHEPRRFGPKPKWLAKHEARMK